MPSAVLVYQASYTHDGRILRETEAMLRAGWVDTVHLVGLETDRLPEHEALDDRRRIWRVPVRWHRYVRLPKLRGLAFYADWWSRIVRRFRREDVRIVHCYSMEALPAGALLKWLHRGARLVYEPLELETEREWLGGFQKKMWRAIEKRLVTHADAVAVVSPSIAEWYEREYPSVRGVRVIRNVPARRDAAPRAASPLRAELGLTNDDMVFIYQGGLSPARGIDVLLDAFRRLPTKQLVVMGWGPLAPLVREHAALHPNIHFRPPVPPEELLRYTGGADVGVHMLPNSCLNAYYCLPNKVFEYLHAGLPIIVPDYPELARLVKEFDCGWTLSGQADDLAAFVAHLTPLDVRAKADGVLRARERCAWEEEEAVLRAIHDDLFARDGAARS